MRTATTTPAAQPTRLLFVAARVPTPQLDGGSQRELNILRALVNLGHSVTFAHHGVWTFAPYADTLQDDIARLEDLGIEVARTSGTDPVSLHMEQHGGEYAAVILTPYPIAHRYTPLVRRYAPRAAALYLALDLGHLQHYRRARVTGKVPDLRRAIEAKRQEAWLAEHADVTLVCSDDEGSALRTLYPHARVVRVAHVAEPRPTARSFDERQGMLFLGSFPHLANVDAAITFVRNVLPGIRRALPGVALEIVGADPRGDVRHLAGEGVRVHGWVSDLDRWFDQVRVFVAPLRYGAGIKIKVLDSLARGVPSVLSPVAAEGLGARHDVHALVSSSPDDFAQAVVRLHSDAELWHRIRSEGLRLIARSFSWQAIEAALSDALAAPPAVGSQS